LFLYNTGARVQEVADLRIADLDLAPPPRVRLHGKGDKWRTCPLWEHTAQHLRQLLDQRAPRTPDAPVFTSRQSRPLTRFGIYKLVRHHTRQLTANPARGRGISPHVFRHTTAVHLLEAGVEINVILDTTNRYAEINTRAKEAALRICEPPVGVSGALPRKPVWRTDESLLAWLNSL
jgi:site-specific recombinase XerD